MYVVLCKSFADFSLCLLIIDLELMKLIIDFVYLIDFSFVISYYYFVSIVFSNWLLSDPPPFRRFRWMQVFTVGLSTDWFPPFSPTVSNSTVVLRTEILYKLKVFLCDRTAVSASLHDGPQCLSFIWVKALSHRQYFL